MAHAGAPLGGGGGGGGVPETADAAPKVGHRPAATVRAPHPIADAAAQPGTPAGQPHAQPQALAATHAPARRRPARVLGRREGGSPRSTRARHPRGTRPPAPPDAQGIHGSRVDAWQPPSAPLALDCGFKRGLADKYDLGRPLGEGGFGVVRIVTARASGTQFACKTIAKRLDVPNLPPGKQALHIGAW